MKEKFNISNTINMKTENRYYWDKSQIDLNDLYDRVYWSTLFGISEEQLSEAIETTKSNCTEKVFAFLNEKGLIKVRGGY